MVKNQKRIEQIAGIALIAAIIMGCGFVLRPFLSAILWAAILCFATWPLHEVILKCLGQRRNIAAAVMTGVLSLVLIIPFVVVGFTFTDSIRSGMEWLDTQEQAGGLPPPPQWVDRIPLAGHKISEIWLDLRADAISTIAEYKPQLKEAGMWLLRHSLDMAHGVFQLVMSVLIAFFFYRDGVGLVVQLREGFQRISGDYSQHLVDVVKTTVRSVVYGVIGTGLAQGIVAGIGFAIASVPSPMLLGLLTFFLSFVPFGPPIIWIGASIWLFAQGLIGWGIFMAVYGLLAISSVDNVVKPWIISRGSKLSFIIMFIGVLGGITAFGFIGLFLGPTLLAVGFSLTQEILGQRHRNLASKRVHVPPAESTEAPDRIDARPSRAPQSPAE